MGGDEAEVGDGSGVWVEVAVAAAVGIEVCIGSVGDGRDGVGVARTLGWLLGSTAAGSGLDSTLPKAKPWLAWLSAGVQPSSRLTLNNIPINNRTFISTHHPSQPLLAARSPSSRF